MGELFRLNNPIQNYAWGSHTVLAEMRGVPAPTEKPEAEVWVGAHPSGPSVAEYAGEKTALNELIEKDPSSFLAEDRKNDSFPYLFKILAIDAPLSIQVHPTDEQALAGFEDENARGVALDDPARNYKDQYSKPETVLALSDMKILTGVREAGELQQLAEVLELTWLKNLLSAENPKELLTGIIRLSEDDAAAAVAATVEAAASYRSAHEQDDDVLAKAADLVAHVAAKYPGDRGLLVAFVMNLVELAPGESAYTPDGQVHAYISGTAIELMNPSDNVMRAGLTPKHIDTDELIKILALKQDKPEIQTPTPVTDKIGTYSMWDERLSVTRIRVREGEPVEFTFEGTSTLLSTGGLVTVTAGEHSFDIKGTESVMHVGEPVTAQITGNSDLFVAMYR